MAVLALGCVPGGVVWGEPFMSVIQPEYSHTIPNKIDPWQVESVFIGFRTEFAVPIISDTGNFLSL
jgi:hypothetical protein